MSDDLSLPTTWATLTIADAVQPISTSGKKIPQNQYQEAGRFPVIDQGQQTIGGFTDDSSKLVECEPPVIVFGDHTKVIKLIRICFAPGADGVKVLKPHGFFEPLMFKFLLDHVVLGLVDKGYARHYQHLAKATIPLPPLAEQKRIVAKIEELFSELEAGEESLRTARRQLGVYRQSLLKQAFEGKLTETWRSENPDKLESPELLLTIAANARREQWTGRGKYPAAKGPKLDAERPIPSCWTYASVDQVTLNFDGARVPLKREDRDKRPGAYPYYGASGIIDDIDDYLFEGDFLLIAEDGANLLSRSTPIAFQAHGRFWVNNHAHIVQPVTSMLMRYLELYLNGRDLTRFITGTAQPKLTQANLNQVPVPLCSLPEQQEIVRLLDEQFEAIERNEREIDAALKRSAALRQSILKKAFSGQLVPQDPSDEPASALLERMAKLREASASKPVKKKAVRKVNSVP